MPEKPRSAELPPSSVIEQDEQDCDSYDSDKNCQFFIRWFANAKFRIEAVDGSFGPAEFVTDQNGEIDLSELPTGAYGWSPATTISLPVWCGSRI